ncbi:hypothetical protein [Gordonia sp. (in: high G+C Gram-positive bacteria)]|uniref:hypothetical protein n=2 Tax=Gordonia sp. (in: high G+C Gram-positive bacteria) TaxID=84139 RepID=UPI003C794376
MNNHTIRRPIAAAIGAIATMGTLATPGIASAVPEQYPMPASLSIAGDLLVAPGVHLLNIDASGMRDKHGKTAGTYVATVMNGSSKTPIQVKGPITCIYTHGDTASLVYPISATSPNLVPNALRDRYAVKISVRKGNVDHVGVQGPMPTDSFRNCLPGSTPFVFQGKITIGQ